MNITLQYIPINTYGFVNVKVDNRVVMVIAPRVPIYGKYKVKKLVNYRGVYPKTILTIDDAASYLAIKKSYYFLGNPS